MRVAPVGLVGHDCMAGPVFHLGAESAALTHGHPSGYLSAGVMAALIHSLLQAPQTVLTFSSGLAMTTVACPLRSILIGPKAKRS